MIALGAARASAASRPSAADASHTPFATAQREAAAFQGGHVELRLDRRAKSLGQEGFVIRALDGGYRVEAAGEPGLLYGVYALERHRASGTLPKEGEKIEETPFYSLRMLDHWDNLDGTIERGYAGKSLWRWDELPDSVSPRYGEYARRNAMAGINGAVLNNVNASPKILDSSYLSKVAAIADALRPYAVRVYLSVNFASPMLLGGLPTADPADREVAKWWKRKCNEIYRLIPDFGGFLVKANSEGQPGPYDFGRTHAEGANMLARALSRHGGKVIWRAFVYSPSDADRAKQAYLEFQPLDGRFDSNVIVQVKNGPIDFQPREPFSPLFGAMPATPQAVEFQITQEYLGHSNHLAFLAPMWEEFFSHVDPSSLTGAAGVSNVGDCANMTSHPLAVANWYAFGRLAWDPRLTSRRIVEEWLPMNVAGYADMPRSVRDGLEEMMLQSREAVVDYMMPLGLHHIFAFGHHYGPEPWCEVEGARADWLPKYYHRADSAGLGFDRSARGSDAVGQYPEPYRSLYGDMSRCPENLLLWFHHVPWNHRMRSGSTLWDELCRAYQRGCDMVERMQRQWAAAKPYVDPELFTDVEGRLMIQARDAQWWKDACLLYFGQFSGMPLPDDVAPPVHTLEEMMRVKLPISNFECPTREMLNNVR